MSDSIPPSNLVGSRPMRYLIGPASGGSLMAVGAALSSNPNVTVRQVVGPQENPVMIVAEMAPEHATLLQAQFAGQVVIEPDAQVFPTGGPGI